MGRLRQLKPRIASSRPRIASQGHEADRRKLRDQVNAMRRNYKTAAWKRLRWQVLLDAQFTCARCGTINSDTSRLVADHKRPHRGDPDLFWDRENLQCLCKACHDGAKQAEERRLGLAGG